MDKIEAKRINPEQKDPVDLDDEYEKFKQEIQSSESEAKESTTKSDQLIENTNLPELTNSRRDKALDMENEKYQQKKQSILERYRNLPGSGKTKFQDKAKSADKAWRNN